METLRIVLHEAQVGAPPSEEQMMGEPSEIRNLLSGTKSIAHLPGCRVFELVWPDYIGYSVVNESYGSLEPTESIGEGQLLKTFTKSVYLDYLAQATFASSDFPGPFKHWAIYCLDHIVNVASTEEPIIHVTNGI